MKFQPYITTSKINPMMSFLAFSRIQLNLSIKNTGGIGGIHSEKIPFSGKPMEKISERSETLKESPIVTNLETKKLDRNNEDFNHEVL